MLNPLLKWVGGKRQLLPLLTERMPASYDRYYEPFFGGGALCLALEPERIVINDFNSSLVRTYRAVRDDADALSSELMRMQSEYNALPDMEAKRLFYLACRDEYNRILRDPSGTHGAAREAVLLVFLNKSGFNGVYRVNGSGAYNVPFGRKTKLTLFDRDNLRGVSELLKGAEIREGDFEAAVSDASSGDFVFFDSPYHATFDHYQKGGFSEEDHRRLADLFAELTDRGVKCMLTNSDTAFMHGLYDRYHIETVPVRRAVNRDASGRVGTEIIVRNYLS